MSDYQSHSGKLKKLEPLENETFEQQCKRLWLENGKSEDDYTEDNFYDELSNKYVNLNDKIWEILEQEVDRDTDGTVCKIFQNPDGTYYFYTYFYNGGTCLNEMLEDELARLDK